MPQILKGISSRKPEIFRMWLWPEGSCQAGIWVRPLLLKSRIHPGGIQVYINRDQICPGEDKTLYDEVYKHLLDLGDFIGVKGYTFVTKTGETSIHASELTLLSKSLKPLPVVKIDADGVVHDAFTDPEQRYRQRYVDLVVNPGIRKVFQDRTTMYNTMRNYLNAKRISRSGNAHPATLIWWSCCQAV